MSKHTPGPYRAMKGVEGEPERWIIVSDNGTQPFHIATIENGQPGDTLDTEEATAHLFAESHDLLEALQALMSNPHIFLEDLVYDVREREGEGWEGPAVKAWIEAVKKAETAIAKATNAGGADE